MSVDAVGRLQRIEAEIRRSGRVKVVDLAAELDVSEMTIRRDLDALAEEGVVRRIRGGAVSIGLQPFIERFSRHVRAKGTSETTLEDAEVKLALADVVAEVVVAVDASKLVTEPPPGA